MKIYTVLFLLLSYYLNAQDLVSFSYDNAGNQITRELICISCDDPLRKIDPDKITDEDLVLSQDHESVSYYPNPVLEQLYIKWTNTSDLFVNSLELYALSGQVILTNNNLKGKDSTSVDFNRLAQGMYTVILIYNNGEKKDLKVIKK